MRLLDLILGPNVWLAEERWPTRDQSSQTVSLIAKCLRIERLAVGAIYACCPGNRPIQIEMLIGEQTE